ncbi:MAG: GxxExxY protein [Chitinophagales bacterium]|nr:GxxExxY protein [Chitinophagales bacterium]
MTKNEYKYSDITGKIIGCAMEVHKILGNGFQEVIYQRALANEMRLQNLNFGREIEMQIFYKGEEIGTRRVDFLLKM